MQGFDVERTGNNNDRTDRRETSEGGDDERFISPRLCIGLATVFLASFCTLAAMHLGAFHYTYVTAAVSSWARSVPTSMPVISHSHSAASSPRRLHATKPPTMVLTTPVPSTSPPTSVPSAPSTSPPTRAIPTPVRMRSMHLDEYIQTTAMDAAFAALKHDGATHVTITVLGSAQNIFYDNFVTHLVEADNFGPVVTFCLDIVAENFCNRIASVQALKQVRQICIPPSNKSDLFAGEAWKTTGDRQMITYGDATYFKIVALKPSIFYHALKQGLATLMSDIDVVVLRSPFDYFLREHLGQSGIWVSRLGIGARAANTGILFATPSERPLAQAHRWAEQTAQGVDLSMMDWRHPDQNDKRYTCDKHWVELVSIGEAHGIEHNDQEVFNHLCSCDDIMSTIEYSDDRFFAVNCAGCDNRDLMMSHCTHGASKIPAMKACNGWWNISVATEKDNHYCGSNLDGACPPDFLH